MKKAIILASFGAIILASCNPVEAAPDRPAIYGMDKPERVRVFVDPETKCQYLVVQQSSMGHAGGGITPRMNSFGSQVCLRQ